MTQLNTAQVKSPCNPDMENPALERGPTKNKKHVPIMTQLNTAQVKSPCNPDMENPALERGPKTNKNHVPIMTQLNTAQVKSPYYPLTNEEWLKVTQELKPAEIVILYHLRTLTPFGERPTPVGVRDLAKTLSLNPGTVSRALKRLDQLGYIELELVQVNVKVLSKGLLFDRKHSPAETLENPGVLPPLPPLTGNSPLTEVLSTDNTCCLQTTPVVYTQHPLSVDNDRDSEPLPEADSGVSKTLKTSKEFKKERETRAREKPEVDMSTGVNCLQVSDLATTEKKHPEQVAIHSAWEKYSAPGGDPEFFEFVVRQTAKLPEPPADARCAAEGWIRKQGHLLYPQYLAWQESQRQIAAAKAAAELPPPPPSVQLPPQEVPDLTLEERLERYTIMWKTPVCRKAVRSSIELHPHWGLRIGKSGPELAEGVTLNQEKNSTSSPEAG